MSAIVNVTGTLMNQQHSAYTLPEQPHSAQSITSKTQAALSSTRSVELPAFSLFSAGQIGREATERFIDQQFFKSYGAQHSEYMPWLLSMSQQGAISACAGIALAEDKCPLFLERYLPASIETLVSECSGISITRAQIAEVGNLAGSSFCGEHIGSSRLLYIVLASVLEELGIQWMVFTGTGPLLNSLQRLGLEYCVLGHADDSSLDETERKLWGSYYQYQPRVVVAPLISANESIRKRAQFASIRQHYVGEIAAMTYRLAKNAEPSRQLAR